LTAWRSKQNAASAPDEKIRPAHENLRRLHHFTCSVAPNGCKPARNAWNAERVGWNVASNTLVRASPGIEGFNPMVGPLHAGDGTSDEKLASVHRWA
jgi:hypothetical protein